MNQPVPAPGIARTPDSIAAEQLLDRAQQLEDAGQDAAAAELRRLSGQVNS